MVPFSFPAQACSSHDLGRRKHGALGHGAFVALQSLESKQMLTFIGSTVARITEAGHRCHDCDRQPSLRTNLNCILSSGS